MASLTAAHAFELQALSSGTTQNYSVSLESTLQVGTFPTLLRTLLLYHPLCSIQQALQIAMGFAWAEVMQASLHGLALMACVLWIGLPQNVQQALARGAELGFASQPSQPAVKPPHKPPPIAPRSALPPPIAVPPAAERNGHLQQQQQEQQQGLATAGGTAHVVNPGKRAAARLFQDTQTEYVRIDTASKRPRKDLLTDHQKEVAARHRQGLLPTFQHRRKQSHKKCRVIYCALIHDCLTCFMVFVRAGPGREGIITHTRLDVSQDALSLLKASASVPDSERVVSPVVIDNKVSI